MRGDTGYAYLPAGQAEVEFGKYEQRIRQLEKQCAVLAAEVDAQRPIIEACEIAVRDGAIGVGYGPHLRRIYEAVRNYQASNPK